MFNESQVTFTQTCAKKLREETVGSSSMHPMKNPIEAFPTDFGKFYDQLDLKVVMFPFLDVIQSLTWLSFSFEGIL